MVLIIQCAIISNKIHRWVTNFNSLSIVKLLPHYDSIPATCILPLALSRPRPQRLEVVKFLLDVGTSINDRMLKELSDGPAINHAMRFDSNEILLKLLLSRRARVDILDALGQRCLDIVRKWGTPQKGQLILSYVKSRGNS
jgi:hypothetical protein